MKEINDKKENVGMKKLNIAFLRHSHKGHDGNLDEDGIRMAKDFEISIPVGTNFEIFTSDILRAKETGIIIGAKLGVVNITATPVLSEFPYTDERIDELGLSGGKWLLVDSASRLLASKIARFTLEKVENIGIKSKIIAISHVPPIMAFLGHTLAFSKGKNEIDEEIKAELLSLFKGFVEPLDGFEISADSKNVDLVQIVVKDRKIEIPATFLKELSNSA